MLKSTHEKYQPPPAPPAQTSSSLPPGWTEHVAPAGHTYYYNAELKKSTYTRPEAAPIEAPIPSYGAGQFAGGFSHNAFPHQQGHAEFQTGRPGTRGGHSFPDRGRPGPQDRPKHKYIIPGCEPWVLVKTKLGRRFVHNSETRESLWKFPADVMKGVVEFDRIQREKKERRKRGEPSDDENEAAAAMEELQAADDAAQRNELEAGDDDEDGSSEYTEITDDEGREGGEGEVRSKRQRTEEPAPDGPIEFNEDDIAFELDEMEQEEYGFDNETWDKGVDDTALTEEDSRTLFCDLLEDFRINPYSTWEKIIEDGHIIEDSRYTALPNMKSRRAVWDQWSAQMMQDLKEEKEKQEKKDPKIPYFSFLEANASTKLLLARIQTQVPKRTSDEGHESYGQRPREVVPGVREASATPAEHSRV